MWKFLDGSIIEREIILGIVLLRMIYYIIYYFILSIIKKKEKVGKYPRN